MSKVAVVTGASGGIGAACAAALVKKGYVVVGISRHKPQNGGDWREADITDCGAVGEAFDSIAKQYGGIDILVNNAGFGISGAVEFTDNADAKKQFDVNLFGTLNCTKAALPYLRQSRGMIINISSVAAVLSIPYQSFYSAVKASVNALTLALRNELKPHGVRVCAVMPGDVKTGFTSAREKEQRGADIYPNMQSAVAAMEKDEQNGMPPSKVAQTVVRAAGRRKPRALWTVGGKYKLFVLLAKLLPVSLSNDIVGMLYR